MADLLTGYKIPFAISFSTPSGAAAQVDGVPVLAVSDETVIALDVAADGVSGFVVSVAPGGPARMTVTADADLGNGVETLTGVSEDITVTLDPAKVAAVINFTFGAPVPVS